MRLQSAMEYLATYSWAILIIAVALAALYFLGVFNPASFEGQQCILPSGLSCTIVGLAPNGLLTINLLQTTQSQINITATGCSSNSIFSANALPKQIAMPTGTNTTLAVQCYSGSSQFSGPVGSPFSGYVLISYNETFTGFPHTASGKVFAKVT